MLHSVCETKRNMLSKMKTYTKHMLFMAQIHSSEGHKKEFHTCLFYKAGIQFVSTACVMKCSESSEAEIRLAGGLLIKAVEWKLLSPESYTISCIFNLLY